MKRIIIFASILAVFLFSFTLLSDDDKIEKPRNKTELQTENTEIVSDIDSKLENIDKLDFSKIESSSEKPDFDAHAGLD